METTKATTPSGRSVHYVVNGRTICGLSGELQEASSAAHVDCKRCRNGQSK